MRRLLTNLAVGLVVLALAAPAAVRAAGPAGGPSEVAAPATAGRVDALRAAEATRGGTTLRAAASRAVESAFGDERRAEPAAGVTAARTAARARRQMGGGKGALIMGLVYTAVGIGATVYMYKMVKDQQNDPEN